MTEEHKISTTSEHRIVHGHKRRYGWKKSPTPHTDHHIFSISLFHKAITNVDLRPYCPPVYDQGELGSCTANAICAAYEIDEIKQKETSVFMPSRLFVYYNERDMEGTVNEDAGAIIHDGIKVVNTIGVCPESDWMYDISKFTIKPPQNCYDEAQNHKTKDYRSLKQDLQQLKQCLINGFPFVCGISVFESFESEEVAKTGIVPMPGPNEQCIGAHAVGIIGFLDSKQSFILRNSWGSSWGDGGYCYIPYSYICDPNLASEFWVISSVVDK